MYARARDRDTIVAVSTAAGAAGIAVLRVSGCQALSLSRKALPFLPEGPESHRVYYGFAVEPSSGEKIDEVLASYFAEGRSFTGEETIEVSCHGSPVIAENLQRALIESGCRLADRGEFTYRAFMSGRIDLVQAESVLELIESQSQIAARVALRHLEGDLSKRLKSIEDGITWVLANLEANIDFAQEDIVVAATSTLKDRLGQVKRQLKDLVSSYSYGRQLSEGLVVGLFGPPNVGKSSLLNAMLGQERAIVTEVPGTTRDIVDGVVTCRGHTMRLLDTAGFRETSDLVEGLGLAKSREAMAKADFCAWVFDLSSDVSSLDLRELEMIPKEKLVLVFNKADLSSERAARGMLALRDELFQTLLQKGQRELLAKLESLPEERWVLLSALKGTGVEALLAFLTKHAETLSAATNSVVMSGRQFDLLKKCLESLRRGEQVLHDDGSPEFVSFELREAVLAIHEILGQRYDDQVMDRVFREFCLGK